MHAPRPVTPRRGFTLIELLTVIAIIGILAAIIIPTVGRVRQSARAVQSGSNLRELHRATMLYAADNKNSLPKGTGPAANRDNWEEQLRDYLPFAIRQTTLANPNAPTYPPTNPPYNTYSAHPMMNLGNGRFLRIDDIRQPSRFILFGDGVQGANTTASLQFKGAWIDTNGGIPSGRQPTDPLDGDTSGATSSGSIGYYNGGKAHVVRLDGSLSIIAPGELTYGDFAWR